MIRAASQMLPMCQHPIENNELQKLRCSMHCSSLFDASCAQHFTQYFQVISTPLPLVGTPDFPHHALHDAWHEQIRTHCFSVSLDSPPLSLNLALDFADAFVRLGKVI
jgi:hypothetical protein